jgi:hypothetical protein
MAWLGYPNKVTEIEGFSTGDKGTTWRSEAATILNRLRLSRKGLFLFKFVRF